MGSPSPLIVELRRDLGSAGNPGRATKQQQYMKSALPFYGVSVPEVRRITRKSLRTHPIHTRADLEETVLELWNHVGHREEWYAALAIMSAPPVKQLNTLELVPLYRHLIVTGAWWDVVDDVATHLVGPLVLTDPDAMVPLMLAWADDDDLWLRRAAVLCQVGAKTATDAELLAAVLAPNLNRFEFFLRKAVGWALRDYAHAEPEWVRRYLSQHREQLSALSYREAAKHLDGSSPP